MAKGPPNLKTAYFFGVGLARRINILCPKVIVIGRRPLQLGRPIDQARVHT